ncbi:hypothetical protein J1N35_006519 [Gossypium stocksii]|uniref:S-acyltransferase n=1 Tax=Gossypium stocksii TaxID=47602 RepID=A0A9D3WEU3_9ROSI|nr:hypothetical protein J1N35_006519 [Gossypium stocksii]
MKRGFSFSVTVVVSAIVFIYFCTVFVFIDRWFGLMTSPGIMNAVAFTGVAFMCVLNYAYAILADPGRVPSSFMPDIEDPEVPIHEIKRKGGDLRFCQKCSCFKPPRAHHCRVCKRCILRMDHHCNWINNCVGHANYKVFFVFVVYAVIACIYSLILLVGSLTNDSQNDKQHGADTFRVAYVISGLLLVPLSVALSVLLGWHIYLILQNKTTIEYHEGVRAMWLAEKGGTVYKHPYDLGAYENLTTVISINVVHSLPYSVLINFYCYSSYFHLLPSELFKVLGPSIFCWICPFSRHIGNGLRFRTAYDRVSTSSTSK